MDDNNCSTAEYNVPALPLTEMRQSPLDVTVVTPDGRKILIIAVNPSESASFIKQALQEFQESAQYTSYAFETEKGVQINEYIEIANYASFNEEVSNMTINLVHAQYDIKKSRLQLKRVQDMIAYPPISRCNFIDADREVFIEAVSQIDASHEDNNVLGVDVLEEKDCGESLVDKQIDIEVEVTEDNHFLKSPVAKADGKVDDVDVVESLSVREPIERQREMNVGAEEEQKVSNTAISADINSYQEGEEDVHRDETLYLATDFTAGRGQESLHEETPASEVKEMSNGESKDELENEIAIEETLIAKSIPKRTTEILSRKKKYLPSEKEIFAPIKLGMFFNETLLRGSSTPKLISSFKNENSLTANGSEVACKQLSDCVKSISASGWNPPPLYRKAQGDLMYVEVVTGKYVQISSVGKLLRCI